MEKVSFASYIVDSLMTLVVFPIGVNNKVRLIASLQILLIRVLALSILLMDKRKKAATSKMNYRMWKTQRNLQLTCFQKNKQMGTVNNW